MSFKKKVIISIIIVVLLLPLALYGYMSMRIENIKTDTKTDIKKTGITNILLLGTDGRENESVYRSDCMMILTVDNTHNSVKLTSLARDTYVEIPGEGMGKLNASYFWGKEELLFKTIENEFGLEIDKYIKVDFEEFMDIITALDGVEVDMTEDEIEAVNDYAPGIYDSYDNDDKGEMKLVSSGEGTKTSTGYQALAYCRIRHIDNAIYRDERQRKVILAVASKIMDKPVSEYPKIIKALLPSVSTNIGKVELLSLAESVKDILSEGEGIKEGEFPIIDDVHVKGCKYKNAGWVWLYDKNSIVVLKDFIFDDIDMKDNEYLNDNSNIELNY